MAINFQTNRVAMKEQELRQLLMRAEGGDRSVLPDLRRILDNYSDIWQSYGDLAAQAEGALIQLAAGNNLMMAESLQRKLNEMKKELGGRSPSPLEKLLIERVTATWLQTNYTDALVAQSAGASEARSKMIQRQQDGASKRHLAAIKMLATVRKLLTPVISPIEIATRMDWKVPNRHRREGVAGTVPVMN